MVANLYFVYKALEDAFDEHASSSSSHPSLSLFQSQPQSQSSHQTSESSSQSSQSSSPHPLLAPVYFPKELHRAAALEENLAFYYGDNWRELTEEIVSDGGAAVATRVVRPSPVAEAYVARLQELSSGKSPELLVPHAYTRYLGDLSGGQVCVSTALIHRHTAYIDLLDLKTVPAAGFLHLCFLLIMHDHAPRSSVCCWTFFS